MAGPTPPAASGGSALVTDMVAASRRIGADPEFVRAGGGNSSAKAGGVLHIKPSGVSLAGLTEESLIALAMDPLLALLDSERLGATGAGDIPPGSDEVLRVGEAARLSAPDGRRPSVELLFHALFPESIVLHTHPTVVNMLTCASAGEALATRLFGEDALWIPYTDPGLPLARAIRDARRRRAATSPGLVPRTVLLQNHGLIVSGGSGAEVEERSRDAAARIGRHLDTVADLDWGDQPGGAGPATVDPDVVIAVRSALAVLLGSGGEPRTVVHDASPLALAAAGSPIGHGFVRGGPLTPDQIVYAGSWPLLVPDPPPDPAAAVAAVERAFRERSAETPDPPVVALVAGAGLFAGGDDEGQAGTALVLELDALAVAAGAQRLGGVRPLAPVEREFIERWEAEAYRRGIAAQAGSGASRVGPA